MFGERLAQGDLHVPPEYHTKSNPKLKSYFQELYTSDSTRTKKPFKVSLTLYALNLVELLQSQKCLSLAVIINSLGFHTRETDYTSLILLHKSYEEDLMNLMDHSNHLCTPHVQVITRIQASKTLIKSSFSLTNFYRSETDDSHLMKSSY